MAGAVTASGAGSIELITVSIAGTSNKGTTMSQVVLYGTRFCPFCTAARRLLTTKGINYQDVALDTDPQLRSEIMERSSRNTVPQIWVGDVHVGGYTDLLEFDVQGTLDSLINTGVEMPMGDSI